MTETATITVPRIRDGDGQPTCLFFELHCPFLMTSGFGTREHCYWQDGRSTYRPLLMRREHGSGTTIPHADCPVWQEVASPAASANTTAPCLCSCRARGNPHQAACRRGTSWRFGLGVERQRRHRRFRHPVLIMETITKARRQLDALLLELEQRETAAAQAMETLTVDDRVRAAWAEATMAERFRVLALIDQQIGQLNGAGMNTILLRTLRGVVCDG